MGPPWRGTWIAGSSDSELHARDVRPWRVSARSATVGRVNVGPANIGSAAVGAPSRKPRERSGWRAVAVPAEHGGWGLTLEPALLGLLVAPSWAGLAIAVAALGAFLLRTPLRLVLVDRHRHRSLPRTRLAVRFVTAETALVVGAATIALLLAGSTWLVPVALAAPLVAVELGYEIRSRGRRLAPELCGAVGVASVASAAAIAGGSGARLAAGLWLVLTARIVASIPFVRTQIARLRNRSRGTASSDAAQAVGGTLAATAGALATPVLPGAATVGALCLAQLVWVRRPAIPPRTLGLRQMALGFLVVGVTAVGVAAS